MFCIAGCNFSRFGCRFGFGFCFWFLVSGFFFWAASGASRVYPAWNPFAIPFGLEFMQLFSMSERFMLSTHVLIGFAKGVEARGMCGVVWCGTKKDWKGKGDYENGTHTDDEPHIKDICRKWVSQTRKQTQGRKHVCCLCLCRCRCALVYVCPITIKIYFQLFIIPRQLPRRLLHILISRLLPFGCSCHQFPFLSNCRWVCFCFGFCFWPSLCAYVYILL